jgi:hypothetical protein
MRALLAHCRPRVHTFSGGELAQLVWGCAALGEPLPARLVSNLLPAIMSWRSERGRVAGLGWVGAYARAAGTGEAVRGGPRP